MSEKYTYGYNGAQFQKFKKYAHQAGINIRNELLPSRAFEVAAAEAIICVVSAVGKAVVCRIRGQVGLL